MAESFVGIAGSQSRFLRSFSAWRRLNASDQAPVANRSIEYSRCGAGPATMSFRTARKKSSILRERRGPGSRGRAATACCANRAECRGRRTL